MRLSIEHKDKSFIHLHITEINNYLRQIKISAYDTKGFYKAGSSYEWLTNRDDLEKQINFANDCGSVITQYLNSGKKIPFSQIVI